MVLDDILNNPQNEFLLKSLEENKNNSDIIEKIILEINKRIITSKFNFDQNTKQYIYIYMFLCNKFELVEELNELIEREDFINLLDETDIDGSMLPSLTSNCNKPRLILMKSRKLKESIIKEDRILSSEDILCDLTEDEIKQLRNDIEIDNYLITSGLCFNTLKKETINRLLEDTSVFSVYSFKAINDFANSYNNPKDLINNEKFLNIYISKLPKDYNYQNKIFKYLTKNKVNSLIANINNEEVLFHLLKDTNNEVQEELLKNKTIKKILSTCTDSYILSSIPTKIVLNIILNKKEKTTDNDIKLIKYLNKKEVESLFKSRPHLYNELVKKLECENDYDFADIVKTLPTELYKDLSEEKIKNFNLQAIINIMLVNKTFKKAILKNKEVINKLYNSVDEHNYNSLIYLFEIGKFSPEEKTRFILNIKPINNSKVIVKLIENIPNNYRKPFSDNGEIRSILLNDKTYKLDDYLKKYLLNNIEELKSLDSEIIISIIKELDNEFIKNILSDKKVITKLLISDDKENIYNLINLVKNNKELLSIINSKDLIENYNPNLVSYIMPMLTLDEQKHFCNNDMIKYLLRYDSETYNTYQKLLNRNQYLLNTIDFNFLNEKIPYFKLFMLEQITKNKQVQEIITEINKNFKLSSHIINSLFYDFDDIDLNTTILETLKLFLNSVIGKNRKYIGNIPKMISVLSEEDIDKEVYTNIFNYLLYLIPRYYSDKKVLKRPLYIDTASTYNDIKYYENNTEKKLTELIISSRKDEEIKEYFIAKHFKLSLEEAKSFLNKYSIYGIDKKIYKEEYEFIDSLKNIMNIEPSKLKKMDSNYKIISMHESFALENKIKSMYSKIYNYEIKNKYCVNKSYIETELCQNLKIYQTPADFLYLICNINIEEELANSNSYMLAWHNTINRLNKGINTSLISSDNLVFKTDYLFGFDGLKEDAIIEMSNKFITKNKNSIEEKYMIPRELIDNTRDINNTIIIDKYAIRPNYNNSNIPTIEPDYLLIDASRLEDASYIEKILTISKEFKNKRNKNGLPIIAIDKEKISNNEVGKIKQLYNKYNRTHEIAIYSNILTRLENNYTAYRTYDYNLASKFDIKPFLEVIKEFTSNAQKEKDIKYIEDIFKREQNKYQNLSQNLSCNFAIKSSKKI